MSTQRNIQLFEHERHTDLESVTVLRQCLSKALNSTLSPSNLKNNILLCFSEWATNLVRHASPQSPSIRVILEKNASKLFLSVSDSGQPWDPTLKDSKDIISQFTESEEGRGIALIQTFCEHLEYSTKNGTNTLSMSWDIPIQTRKPDVLIVDDDPLLLRVYKAYLDKDFTITCAQNGDQALGLIKVNKYDLIISDIQMPTMGGLELRQAIKSAQDGQSIPFIFLTALAGENVQMNANHLGIDDYLIKPVDKKSLLFSVQRVLARSEQVYNHLSHRLDEKITNSLLPKIHSPDSGWDIAVRQRNTGCGGGDFLLSKAFGEEDLYVLADVMGHDVSAKFFSYAYAGYLRGLLNNTREADPCLLLGQLSDSAFDDQLLSQVTLTSCAFSLHGNDEIEFASAGHPCPLLISENGLETISVQGMLPGLLPETLYSPLKLTLGKKQRIALFTDGLFESGDTVTERTQLTKEIEKQLLHTLELPIEEAIDTVMASFDALAGTPPNDDTLLMLIEPKHA
ncbi:SpoIIE family protein phosphatase [Vibrio nigripulchritudo]|uniref:SpoIIE family protein phosphatase n=1 Tax=Vibrio nigripulchritudo TaxID=28173 RepID=UPI00249292AB|nr:SpoIIE family protein phosphatase [Vibrio nigripulchritudo]BDU37390.1 fused response regulator/phosphatase [Vibrio nigripulchritudo]BDU43112.1 fused response regulator/phosphatase [Vibrio nigripulchritudo]